MCWSKFDLIIYSVQNVRQYEDSANNYNKPTFKVPSLALKLRHSIRKCIGIESGKALRKNNIDKRQWLENPTEHFLSGMERTNFK